MVRGLDYYMRTTFEVVHGALGAQNSVLGGGRYDGLAESLGSKIHSPGIGFSIGEDRLVMSVEGDQTATPARSVHRAAWAKRPLRHAAIMARDFRRAGLSVELAEGKLKRAMELANKLAARYTLIVGDNEIAAGRYTLKNMSTGEQLQLTRTRLPQSSPRPDTENIDMETSVRIGFSRRPSPHAHVRGTARLRRRPERSF